MTVLLHISDTHFGTEQAPVVAALLALAQARKPDVLVFSGDVTQRARPHEFAAARLFCDRIGIDRQLVLPGNHDIPLFNLAARLFQPYARYSAAFGPDLEPVVETRDVLVIGVKTTRRMRHKNGVVSGEQVRRVARRLASARRGQLRIVVTHQPAEALRAEDTHDCLRGGEVALQAWSEAGADLVLGGHIHLPYMLDLKARPSRPTARALWCVQAGTAMSERVRHGTDNSVNLIEWQSATAGTPRQCRVERLDYRMTTGEFEVHETRTLSLDA